MNSTLIESIDRTRMEILHRRVRVSRKHDRDCIFSFCSFDYPLNHFIPQVSYNSIISSITSSTLNQDQPQPHLGKMSDSFSPPLAHHSISSTHDSSWLRRMVFLGTGTSGQVPAIHCLTGPNPQVDCDACRDALNAASKNRRACTSVALAGGGEQRQDQR